MGLLGGGGKKVKPAYTGLDTNTSTGILPFPIVYGEQRCSPNVFWYGDFKAHKQKVGKGGGKDTKFESVGIRRKGFPK